MAEENSPQRLSTFYSDFHELYAINLFRRLEYVGFRDLISGDSSAEEDSSAGWLYQNGGVMRHFSVFSTYLVNIFGKERIETASSIMVVVFLLAFLSTSAYVGIDLLGLSPLDAEDERALLLYALIFIAVPFGVAAFLGSISESYEYSHCEECKRDLACERVGEPLVEEIEEKGVIKLVTTEKYECRFCGHIRYKVNKSDKYHDTMPV